MVAVRPTTVTPLHRWVRNGRVRHLLLGLGVAVVMLGIVGMHQLSVGHNIATGQAGLHRYAETVDQAGTAPHGHDAGPPAAMAHLGFHFEPSARAAAGTGAGVDEGCLTCDDHDLAAGSCLLALTLLVLGWLLLPPQLRLVPPFLRPRLAVTLVRPEYLRLVPALTLTELSLRRT